MMRKSLTESDAAVAVVLAVHRLVVTGLATRRQQRAGEQQRAI